MEQGARGDIRRLGMYCPSRPCYVCEYRGTTQQGVNGGDHAKHASAKGQAYACERRGHTCKRAVGEPIEHKTPTVRLEKGAPTLHKK